MKKEKCPTPGQRYSDKFPTARTDKKTNVPGGEVGTLGFD